MVLPSRNEYHGRVHAPFRRINLSTWSGDDDWTDPATTDPPASERLFITEATIVIAVAGRSSLEDDATAVDVGDLLIDAWVGVQFGQGVLLGMSRDRSIVEITGAKSSARVRIVSQYAPQGGFAWLNLPSIANPGSVPALWCYVIRGARHQ